MLIAQPNDVCSKKKSEAYQESLNLFYQNKEKSPLKAKDLESFKGLSFFDVDMTFCVKAKLIKTPNAIPFEMPTTTQRKPMYVQYGTLYFEINGIAFQLQAYQQFALNNPIKSTKLFVPFTDLTSGEESYGGGRYLDVDIPEGDYLYVNFNQCYNPYCAYNEAYSCPLTPAVNHLELAVKAGVKKFKD